jgi:phosphopantetheinyl transferase (holo-ACP synthase)
VFVLLGGAGPVAACTVGVFSGRVLREGRPVLWKNRDVGNPDQAVRYFNDGVFPYVGLIYAGEPSRVWGGVNQAGFAVMNANSFNLGAGAPEGIGDGELMKLALQTCVTLADFQRLMDSLNAFGRSVPCNLGVMDSTGATAMFEAGANSYVRWDSDSLPEGFIVRANFSLSADTTGQHSNGRYLRGSQLVSDAVTRHCFSLPYLIDRVARDLGSVDFDPYPLPFHGTVNSLPFGFLPASATINRTTTRAAVFLVGRQPGEPVSLSSMWTMLGQPSVAVPVPLWVGAQAVPHEMEDAPLAAFCEEAKRLRDYVYSDDSYPGALNSFRLAELDAELGPVKQQIYDATARQMIDWRARVPTSDEIAGFQKELAADVAASYARHWAAKPAQEPISVKAIGLRVKATPRRNGIEVFFPGNAQNRSLACYTAQGRRVAWFDLSAGEYRIPGEHSIQWQPGNLPAGCCFVTLNAEGSSSTVAFTYLR